MNSLKPFDVRSLIVSSPDQGGGEPPAEKPKPDDATGDQEEKRTFSQREVNALMKRQKEEMRAEFEKLSAEAKRSEQDRVLAEQAKWKELADARKQELDEKVKQLEAAAQKDPVIERQRKALEAYRDAQYAAIPDSIKVLLDKLDVVEQIEWLTANADQLAPADGQQKTTQAKSRGTPVPVKGKPATSVDAVAQQRERNQRSGQYDI